MAPLKPRSARLVLTTAEGVLIGAFPPMPVATPWWQDVKPVVDAVRERHGVEVVILRLLEAELDQPPGGMVTYLAEVSERVQAEPWSGELDDHPLRNPYARPGGPAVDLAWARSVLERRGLRRTGAPVQIRTWNLSSLWRIPVEGGAAWLKAVPPFMAHEGAVLTLLAGARVPTLLGHEQGRILMAEASGADLYEAAPMQLRDMTSLLVDLQSAWSGRIEDLLATGTPDWRAPALQTAISSLFERIADDLPTEDRALLAPFVDRLAQRFADLASCGLNDTIIHGDFHPGNVRGKGSTLVLLDWGDSGVGCPLLDQPAFLDRIPEAERSAVLTHWLQKWRDAIPGCDPARGHVLIAPIAAARQAVIYQSFLDRIEPAEHPYHRSDPADWMRRTAVIVREERKREGEHDG